MLSSLEAIAALRSPRAAVAATARASMHEEGDSAAQRTGSSAVHLSRSSVPPPRASSPVRRPSSPVQGSAPPNGDKPLWYVDLGGAETVQMTIEQLIIARRTGKLGEGALVWRAGMPEWRSVGSLIPAAGTSTLRTMPPAAPMRAKQPTLAPLAEPAKQPLGSYERPLATLEFALETAEPAAQPKRSAPSSAPPQRSVSQAAPLRIPTPVPRAPMLTRPSVSQVGPLPAPAPLPSTPRRPAATPLPPLPVPPRASEPAPVSEPAPAPPRAMVMPLLQRLSPTTPTPSPPTATPSSPFNFYAQWRGQRPPWVSVAIAVVLCIAASGSGAFLVRALKLHRQPLSLTPTTVASPVIATTAAPARTVEAAPETPAPSTQIVDIDSLSVERRAPRALARPSVPATPALPTSTANAERPPANVEEESSPPAAPPPAPAKKAKTSDLPAAAHSNPYTTGSVEDPGVKKPGSSTGDEPGF